MRAPVCLSRSGGGAAAVAPVKQRLLEVVPGLGRLRLERDGLAEAGDRRVGRDRDAGRVALDHLPELPGRLRQAAAGKASLA